jgi:hypothetical protein
MIGFLRGLFNRLLIPASVGILWISAKYPSGVGDYWADDWRAEPIVDPGAAFVETAFAENLEASEQPKPDDAEPDAVAEINAVEEADR